MSGFIVRQIGFSLLRLALVVAAIAVVACKANPAPAHAGRLSTPKQFSAVWVNAGDEEADVSWDGAAGEGVDSYSVAISPGNAVIPLSGPSAMLFGLRNGQAYTFTVCALDAAGRQISCGQSEPTVPHGEARQASARTRDPHFRRG